MDIQLIVFFTVIFMILAFVINYIKNLVYFQNKLDYIMENFFNMNKNSDSFDKSIYHFLNDQLMKLYHARSSILMTYHDEKFIVEDLFINNAEDSNKIMIDNTHPFQDTENIDKIIDEYHFIKKLKNHFLTNKHLTMIIPIYQEKRPIAIFIFFFSDIFSFLRGQKLRYIHSRKIHRFVLNPMMFLKERTKNVHAVTIDDLKDYAVISLDSKYNITSWNLGAVMMFGFERERILNTNFLNLFSDLNNQETFNKVIGVVNDTGCEHESKYKLKGSNDEIIMVDINIKSVSLDNVWMGYYLFIKDISQEQIYKDNFQRESSIIKSIINNTQDGIFLLNEKNRLHYYNNKIAEIFKIPYRNMKVEKLFNNSELYKMVSDFINEKETEKSESFFHTDYQIGGKWYNIRIFRLETEVNFRGYVFFFIDNTENVINQQRIKNLNNKYHEDLKLASNMQINLAKNKAVHNPYVNFKCIYRPSGMIGGDFYYVDQINVGKQDFTFAFISDVSGHGIRASILTVLIKDVFNEFKSKVRRPNEVKSSLFLEKLNNKITELNIYPFMYIGVFAVVINHSTLKMNYSSAGAPPALIIRRNKLLEFCIPHQPSIGTEDSYEFKEEIQQMEYGDRIILYTDGIMGLFDTTDEQDLSKENQMDFIRNMIRLPIYKMHEEYENFIKEKISEYEEERKETDKIDEVDDITILFIELKKTKSTIQSMGNFLNINKKKYHS